MDLVIISETSETTQISFELNKNVNVAKTEIMKKVRFMGKDMTVFVIDTDMHGIYELEHAETVARVFSDERKILDLQFTTYWYRYNQEVKTRCNIDIHEDSIQWSMDVLKKLLENSRIDWEDPDIGLLKEKLSGNH